MAAEGKAITVPPESRDDFAKHMRLIEHVDPEPTTEAATVKPDSQSSSKKHVHSDEGNEEIGKRQGEEKEKGFFKSYPLPGSVSRLKML